MTTVLFTQDYLVGDRAVLLNGMVVDDTKIQVLKGRIAYFFGSRHPTAEQRVKLDKAVYAFVFGKREAREAAEAFINQFIAFDTLIIMTRTKSFKLHNSMMSLADPNTNMPEPNKILMVDELDLRAPIGFGSGGDLAICGWACGMEPKNIVQLVSYIDPMTSRKCDVVYREDLRK